MFVYFRKYIYIANINVLNTKILKEKIIITIYRYSQRIRNKGNIGVVIMEMGKKRTPQKTHNKNPQNNKTTKTHEKSVTCLIRGSLF